MQLPDTPPPAKAPHLPNVAAQGTHLLCEWYGCDFSTPALNRANTLRTLCLDATAKSGLTIVGDVFHQFEPQGITGTVLLAESHLARRKFVTVDVYVCNYMEDNTQKAMKLYEALKAHFRPVKESFLQAPRGLRHD